MAGPQYQTPPQPPPVFTATADSILADTNRMSETTKRVYDKVVADVQPDKGTFANVLDPILVDDNKSSAPQRILTFYQHVSPNASLREASNKAEGIMDEFRIETKMREDIFKLVDAVYATRASLDLETEPLHLLTKERQKYIRNGLLLPAGPQRDRFKEIQKRLSQLSIQCQKNLNEENGAIWFFPKELEGVPKDDIDVDQLEKGTGENEGKVKLSFKYTHLFPLMKYALHEETRRKYTIAEANKSNVNVPLFQQIIELRDEAARMLGYADHATMRIEQKMAKTPSNVNEFLGDLRNRLAPGGVKEAERLREYKKRDCEQRGAPFDGNLYMWDVSFYSNMVKQQEYSVDEIEISQYFPVGPTFAGMLKIFEQIFGFVFVELKPEDRARLSPTGKAEDIAWHEDVIIYTVWDDKAAGSGFCGYLYLDLHPRDNKYSHNANFNLEPGYIREDGSRNYPATALVCNFSKPSASKPALLKHQEVLTLFHELGHGIHDLAARTRYSYFHGTAVVEDFVEAPSQMLENWCWTPSVLQSLSRRWDTGEPIPDAMVDKLVRTKRFNSATATLTQLLYGLFDMTVHTPKNHDDIKKMHVGRLWNQLRHDISGIKGPEDQGQGLEWGNRYATIGHYIGGYDAGYYGYLWSEVFSADMFHSFFEKDPMDGKEGRRYRRTVLERGGSMDEMEFLKEFLGREPSSAAFYKELGLSQ
ncbi:peptidase family M3 domain-containing protein [Hirsutella rhossiliensis]|uniref:Peptidase family m3 domain-containing protein n=1 Tax=Hirsutella rhossiliensis TaxID=111463 RepID=A0A9P8N8P4_9HYPO|nr:peptidase family m3 domain-containing protein [Hirsutella rhossiliensis]KAH0966672.1 peptidase family m3 domain-containing protein [Hirsutella rhossiliensis]